MKNILIKIGTVLFIVLLLGSCKKYDEGPWISFRSKEKRIIGTWEVQAFYVNGYDSTQFFRKYDSPNFYINKSYLNILLSDNYTENPKVSLHLGGDWDLENNNKDMKWSFYDPGVPEEQWLNLGPFKVDYASIWEIKRLKMDEFFLETNFEGVLYRLELKRV
jgi:hypothetical protein